MNWDQIEIKWALMTRRIRTDLGDDFMPRGERGEVSGRTLPRRSLVAPTIADSQTPGVKQPETKLEAK